MNPTLIGTGLKIYVHIKLAYLGTVLKKYGEKVQFGELE